MGLRLRLDPFSTSQNFKNNSGMAFNRMKTAQISFLRLLSEGRKGGCKKKLSRGINQASGGKVGRRSKTSPERKSKKVMYPTAFTARCMKPMF